MRAIITLNIGYLIVVIIRNIYVLQINVICNIVYNSAAYSIDAW